MMIISIISLISIISTIWCKNYRRLEWGGQTSQARVISYPAIWAFLLLVFVCFLFLTFIVFVSNNLMQKHCLKPVKQYQAEPFLSCFESLASACVLPYDFTTQHNIKKVLFIFYYEELCKRQFYIAFKSIAAHWHTIALYSKELNKRQFCLVFKPYHQLRFHKPGSSNLLVTLD